MHCQAFLTLIRIDKPPRATRRSARRQTLHRVPVRDSAGLGPLCGSGKGPFFHTLWITFPAYLIGARSDPDRQSPTLDGLSNISDV